MDQNKKDKLKAAGWKVGTVKDFLNYLSETKNDKSSIKPPPLELLPLKEIMRCWRDTMQ